MERGRIRHLKRPAVLIAITMNNGTHYSRTFLAYLLFTAMVCGALVMVIEVLGSRVIGPFFGVSLFVWTSLITVTLISLAFGYAVGGVVADRHRSPDYLFLIIFLAGVLTLLIPVFQTALLKTTVPLGLRGGAFASSLVLFGPVLFLLGCVSPYLVRIAASEMGHIGRTVGTLYAVSTMGSVIGTVLTGFVLIAYLGVNRIFQLSGLILIALAVGYFVMWRRHFVALAALLIPAFVTPPALAPTKVMGNGMVVSVVAARESFYGNVKVVDYRYGHRHTRELIIDGLNQGGIDVGNGLSIYAYVYLLEMIPLGLNPTGRHGLVLGLGPGLVAGRYAARGVRMDVVDIDPNVVAMAEKYFGFKRSGEVYIEDARWFVQNTDRRYDYVIVDVFNGDTTPHHLLSVEAVQAVSQRLRPGGIVAINFIGSLVDKPMMTASIVRTLDSVFDRVELYPAFEAGNDQFFGNLVAVAYNGPERTIRPNPDPLAMHSWARATVRTSLNARFSFPKQTPALLLRDDYNPIDVRDAWLKEYVRGTILDETDWDILLYSGS